MTNREAMLHLEELKRNADEIIRKEPNSVTVPEMKRGVTALELAVAALEKQEPMEPKGKYSFGHGLMAGQCPVCGATVCDDELYCDECGQALKWEEKNEDSD